MTNLTIIPITAATPGKRECGMSNGYPVFVPTSYPWHNDGNGVWYWVWTSGDTANPARVAAERWGK